MLRKTIVLLAAGLSVAGCLSMPQSMQPTLKALPPPSACMRPCPELSRLDSDTEKGADGVSESAGTIWVHEVIDLAGVCRRQHDECRAAVLKERP